MRKELAYKKAMVAWVDETAAMLTPEVVEEMKARVGEMQGLVERMRRVREEYEEREQGSRYTGACSA